MTDLNPITTETYDTGAPRPSDRKVEDTTWRIGDPGSSKDLQRDDMFAGAVAAVMVLGPLLMGAMQR